MTMVYGGADDDGRTFFRRLAAQALLVATGLMALAAGVCGLLFAVYFSLRLVHALGLFGASADDIRFENEQILGFGLATALLASLTLVLQRTRTALAR